MDEHFKLIRSIVLPSEKLFRVVVFEPFASQWGRLGLTEDDLQLLELTILRAPESGDVVPGAGGLRKMRFSPPGSSRGKSGGCRVYYLNIPEHGHLILWAVLSKTVQADISKVDRDAIGRQAGAIKDMLKKRKEQGS